jgi:hypothetical protein
MTLMDEKGNCLPLRVSTSMWSKTQPTIIALADKETVTLDICFNTDSITLSKSEAKRLLAILGAFLLQ